MFYDEGGGDDDDVSTLEPRRALITFIQLVNDRVVRRYDGVFRSAVVTCCPAVPVRRRVRRGVRRAVGRAVRFGSRVQPRMRPKGKMQ